MWGGYEPSTPFSVPSEMDKARASRFSTAKRHKNKQSGGHKLFGGFNLEKSKKEKVRSLNAVGRALSSYQDCEVGGHVSEKAHDLPAQSPSSAIVAAKRFKIPKKFANDSNSVDHASVPRKIRSAMKKRNRESISSDSKKVNQKINGIESLEKDGIKKSKKQGTPGWSTTQAVARPITKDEAEVVETLYALAGMFADRVSNTRSELDGESLPENSSVLRDQEESANAAFEASGVAQEDSPCPERSPGEAAKINCLNETTVQEQSDLLESAEFLVATHSTVPMTKLQTSPMMIQYEDSNKVTLHGSEFCLAMGLNMTRQSQSSHIGRKPDMEVERGADEIIWLQEQHMMKDQILNEGPALSIRASTGNKASFFKSTAAKATDRLDAASSASKQDLMDSYSCDRKISEEAIHKLSWTRCAAHVHISHLIRSLEVHKKQVTKGPAHYERHQMRSHEGSNCGVLMEVHNLNGMRNGISSAPGTGHSATARDSIETKKGTLQQQFHNHDVSRAPLTPGVCCPQKQSFNFLCLSAGGDELKINRSFNEVESWMEPLSKLQVSYYHTLPQQHGLVPFPTPQSQYVSTSYHDRLTVSEPQVLLQQPHYYGNRLCGTQYGSSVSNKQRYHNFWGVQLGAQGGSALKCDIGRAQYSNWHSGRHDSSAVSPCTQVMLPRSPASLGVPGIKITSTSGQQQQLISLAPSRTNGPDCHFPSLCEESRGRFRSRGTPSLQLICDGRI